MRKSSYIDGHEIEETLCNSVFTGTGFRHSGFKITGSKVLTQCRSLYSPARMELEFQTKLALNTFRAASP